MLQEISIVFFRFYYLKNENEELKRSDYQKSDPMVEFMFKFNISKSLKSKLIFLFLLS